MVPTAVAGLSARCMLMARSLAPRQCNGIVVHGNGGGHIASTSPSKGSRLIFYMRPRLRVESATLALRLRSKQLDQGDHSSPNRPALILFGRPPFRGVLSCGLDIFEVLGKARWIPTEHPLALACSRTCNRVQALLDQEAFVPFRAVVIKMKLVLGAPSALTSQD